MVDRIESFRMLYGQLDNNFNTVATYALLVVETRILQGIDAPVKMRSELHRRGITHVSRDSNSIP